MPDGRIYTDARFLRGALQHDAVQMELEYPKTVNKKNVEQPVPIDIGSMVPAQFVISVRILCAPQETCTGTQERAGSQTSVSATQPAIFTAESGRSVYLLLQQGHVDPGSIQPLDIRVFLPAPTTAPQGESKPVKEEESAEKAPVGEVSLCAVTTAGRCCFQGLQIGGDGLAPLEAGPYTLLVRSTGLPDQRILVQLSMPKGKKK
jgi:hypothetical protein